MGYYDVAQICLNGHCITDSANRNQIFRKDFCTKCGAQTIMECPSCKQPIQGQYFEPGLVAAGFKCYVPKYCHACGKPYPWTTDAIDAMAELLSFEDNFSKDETQALINSLPDIISETPRTQLAITRFKKLLNSATSLTIDGVRQFAIDFGCELARKQLGI